MAGRKGEALISWVNPVTSLILPACHVRLRIVVVVLMSP